MIYNWFIGPQSSGSTNWIPFNPHRKAAAVPRESKRSGEEKNRHENQEQIRTTTYNNQQQPPIHNFETLSSSHTNISQIYTYNQPYLEFIPIFYHKSIYTPNKKGRSHGLTLKKKTEFCSRNWCRPRLCSWYLSWQVHWYVSKSCHLGRWESCHRTWPPLKSRTKPAKNVADLLCHRMQKPFITMAPCQMGPY